MLSVNVSSVKLILVNILNVLNLSYKLLFVGVMDRGGNYVLFDEGKCSIEKNGTIFAQGQ